MWGGAKGVRRVNVDSAPYNKYDFYIDITVFLG